MNVQKGDIAYICGSRNVPETNGMIVEVLEFHPPAAWFVKGHAVEAHAKSWGCRPVIFDRFLRPIRDQPGADESLSWASLPTTPTKEVA